MRAFPIQHARSKFPMKLLPSFFGAFAGAIVLSILRTAYYVLREYEPQMSPMMFVLFAPLVALAVGVVSLPIEWVLSRYWRGPATFWQSFIIGSTYSVPLVLLIEHWAVVLVILLNPVTARWFLSRGLSNPTKTA